MFPLAAWVCALTDVSPNPAASTAASIPVLSRFKWYLPSLGVVIERGHGRQSDRGDYTQSLRRLTR
jgi:hypothetical protein